MKYFFTGISYLFHPFIMPFLGLYILFESPTLPNSYYLYDALYFFPDKAKMVLFIVLGILTFIAPAISLLIMYWNKIIPSIQLPNKEDRRYPFVLVTFYYILAYIYIRMQLPEELMHPALMSFIFGIILTFIICFFINFFIKISLHAAAIFGLCGMLLAYNQTQIESNLTFLLYLTVVAGFVAAARLFLNVHSLKETVLGMIIGFGVLFVSVKFGLYI